MAGYVVRVRDFDEFWFLFGAFIEDLRASRIESAA
jgi:hypothetical protein